ncbi:MAG: chitobiase/beta-hexosaminidase C-terminal domain-containing protein [Muribaculaceae bacterium]|nr:chitobiase/beta-hexosaminidase C-terminal domain-containing protein [Muribaculaceae bacterium]
MKKLFTFMALCLLTATMAMAQTTITFDASADVSGNTTASAQTISKDGITLAVSNGILGVQGAYRIYKNQTLTISSTVGNITNVSITCIDKISGTSYGCDGFADAEGLTKSSDNTLATWAGNAASIVLSASGHQVRATKVVVTVGGTGEEIVANPSFTPAAGTYYSPINVEIKCGTSGASIYYTTDGTTPTAASTQYAAALAISESTTLKAIAIKGEKQSEVAEAAYVFGTATDVANIAAYKQITDSTQVRFTNPVNVLAQYGQNLFVRDNTGYTLIYGNTGKTYKTGDVVPAGFTGKKVTFNGEAELSVYASDNFQAAAGSSPIEAELIQASDVDADLFGHYVLIKGATISVAKKTLTDNSGSAPIHTTMGGYSSSTDTTKTYDVYAIVGSYRAKDATETTYQLLPVRLVDPNAGVDNIAAYAALANNTVESIKGDVTVYYVNGQNMYVKDASGYLCVYGSTGQTYKNGDVIPGGFSGTKTVYNGGPEMKSPLTGFLPATANNPVAPEVKTSADVVANAWGQYFVLKDATLGGVSGKNLTITDAAGSAAGYNSFNINLPGDLTVKYDVEGIVATYNNNPQLLITKVTLAGGGEIPVPEVADINALYNLNSGTNAKIKSDVVAIYQNGSNLYVKNGDTYSLVYGRLTNTFENGDIIRGAVASWTTYQNNKQLVPVDSTFAVAEKGAAVEPIDMPLEEIGQDMVHTYFIVKNATLVNDSTNYYTINDGTMDMLLFNKFNQTVTMPTDLEGNKFDVKCFLTVYKSQLELYPVEVTKVGGEEPLKGDVNGDGEVDVNDVNILINIVLGKDDASKYEGRANVDGAGDVDVTDVNTLINLVLGK